MIPDRSLVPDRFLVGVDGSAPSRAALRWALERASSVGATLLLAHVFEPGGDATDSGRRLVAEELLDAQAHEAAHLDPSACVSTVLLEGDAPAELAAASVGCSLLVLGTHKTGFIRGTAFASRFLVLATTSPCPVAFIPDVGLSARRGVVAGSDDTAVGRQTLLYAAADASRTSQILTLVLASPPISSALDRRVSESLELAKSVDRSLRVRARLSARGIAEALVDAASASSLLVIGRSSKTGADRVAQDVLLNIVSPTLIVGS
jgi:nucleotide-binding universal stress UspA family protein